MNTAAKPLRANVKVWVHANLWCAVFIVSAWPLLVALATTDIFNPSAKALEKALAAAVIIQLGLWFARRRCRASDLSWWNGLLFITGFMTIGIGPAFAIIAVLAGVFAIVASILLALVGFAMGDATFAPRQYRRLVVLASRNRMYQ